MGSAIAPPPKDFRVERAIRVFAIPEEKLVILWRLFIAHDREKRGLVLFQDFLQDIIDYGRSPLTDNLPGLIETRQESTLTFGEFVELICTICCFEEMELLKYFFYILDPHRLGIIDVNELKHLLLNIHNLNKGLIRDAIEYLEDCNNGADDDAHTFKFHELVKFRKKYPFAFSPLFRLQTQVQANTLGETWWENHKAQQGDIREEERKKELAKQERLKQEQEQEEAAATEEVLKKRMGIKYWLMPWARAAEMKRLIRIAAIEKEIEAKKKEF